MNILLSNDDGYFATGLSVLHQSLLSLGTVDVVAPERDRSGASNSLTLDRPLTLRTAPNGFRFVNGTPTDCVHLAVTGMLDLAPDMVISGVNHGANMGDDTIYSGTVAAATEGFSAMTRVFEPAGAEASEEDLEDFLRMRRMITDGQTGYIPCSAKESSRAAIRVAIVASVSSPMFEMRKVLPLSLP